MLDWNVLDVVFAATLACELALAAVLAISIAFPGRRIWPPPGRHSWQFRLVWGLIDVATVGILMVCVLDWRPEAPGGWLRIALGALLAAAGGGFALWGIRTLTWHACLGLEHELVRAGPYRFTRNPQYVGDGAMLLGWAIAVGSPRAAVLCVLGALWFAITPFAEEPWLRERYGAAYDSYRRRVPRYLGWPREA